MNRIILVLSLAFFTTMSCQKEVVFDEDKAIDLEVKKGIYEYQLISIDRRFNYVIVVQRRVSGDTVEFIIYATNSIAEFESLKVYYRGRYLDINIFTNYKNKSFRDSCGLEEAAQYLDKDEYAYFLEQKKVPPPFTLADIMNMKLVFVNGKLKKKEYYY